ncbi:MAG TPA: hypothetical protein VF041_23205 [Gemmatimonadaceae bacterium]
MDLGEIADYYLRRLGALMAEDARLGLHTPPAYIEALVRHELALERPHTADPWPLMAERDNQDGNGAKGDPRWIR